MSHSLEKNKRNETKSVTMELHIICPSNSLLNEMKVIVRDKCTFCPDTIDYIEHFFCECPTVVYLADALCNG